MADPCSLVLRKQENKAVEAATSPSNALSDILSKSSGKASSGFSEKLVCIADFKE